VVLNASNMTFGYVIVKILNIKHDSMPLEDPFFLFAMGVPLCYHVLFFITLFSIHSRIRSVTKIFRLQELQGLNKTIILNRIKFIMLVLDKMNDTMQSINKFYMFNTMIVLLKFVLINLMTSFLAYDVLVHKLGLNDVILVLGGFSYSATMGLGCILVFKYALGIKKSFDTIFFQLLDIKIFSDVKLHEKKIRHQTFMALLQIESFSKEISCGLFSVKWQHLFLMLAATFNYLCVMIQFDSMVSMGNF
jgi:hypothetical protein